MEEEQKQKVIGAWNGAFAYLIWGVLPLYWKALDGILAEEILAHRILWSFVLMIVVLVILKKWGSFLKDLKIIITNKRLLLSVILSGILISGNWLIYIWAVNHNHVLETSLGYYINPLISVLLGIMVLKERLSVLQVGSFILAASGVVVLTLQYGKFPWVSLSLALSFGLYGLVKKKVNLSSTTGLTVETMVVTPLAVLYLISLFIGGKAHFAHISVSTDLLLIGTGVVTAIPLLLFAESAKRVPLTMLGFLQYISPTITLILGVFVFHEQFTKTHFIAFSCIWLALVIYSLSNMKRIRIFHPKARKHKTSA